MKLLLVAGFLGAGKTTLISKLLPAMEEAGMRLAVIENEFGEQSIDSTILSRHHVNITTISGGCVCCQLTGNLIAGLAEIEEEINPHWCIIELSGMAITANTLAVLRQYYRPDLEVLSIVVADGQRWKKLQKIAGSRIQSQLSGADAIYLSKLNLAEDMPPIDSPLPKLMRVQEVLDVIMAFQRASGVLPHAPMQETGGEVTHRHFAFHEVATKQDIAAKLEALMMGAGKSVAVDGIIPGHIKGIAVTDEGCLTASMTVMGEIDVKDFGQGEETEGYAIDIYTLI